MKKQKGMSLLVLTIIIVIIITIGVVSVILIKNGKTKEHSVINDISANNNSEENKDSDAKENVSEEDFWLYKNYKNWPQQKEISVAKSFKGLLDLPIDLKTADNFAKLYVYHTMGKEKKASNIMDILNSEEEVHSTETVFINYGELNERGSYDSFSVELENFADERISIKECFENNWWNISCSINDFGITLTEEERENNYLNSDELLLNKLINNWGGPKHIHKSYEDINDSYKTIYYLLRYEYEEFSIGVFVEEFIGYGTKKIDIKGTNYYPNEYRDKDMEKNKNNGYFEIIK